MERSETLISLAALDRGRRVVIRGVGRCIDGVENSAIERRLREIGFEEGREAEVRHVSPIGRDPIAVRVDSLSIAVRRSEAAFVLVALLAPPVPVRGPADDGGIAEAGR